MKYHTLIAAGLMMLGACTKDRIKGEGTTISETRIVSPFSTIDCEGSSNVHIIRDSVYQVVVTGYQNLVPIYETQVSGATLRLKYKDDHYNVKNDNIRISVHMPQVSEVNLNGSGNIFSGPGFSGNFSARINGSGNLTLGMASFRNANYYINGSGNIDALAAVADTAYVTVSGSGNVDLSVVDYLVARINGSGNINYKGTPVSDVGINGSGKVKMIQ